MKAQREILPEAEEPTVMQDRILSEPAHLSAGDGSAPVAQPLLAVDATALCMLYSALGG
jgi:hypothetical protein